mmetsp:Transcript_16831/g.31878  ORF Transcript_16831/g.31878 Transcript_16831/m.31878 type:complete len:289 (+) Transcript_16831:140-1006(+)|eukprot:CAMPEP_0176492242 /NCGR_PEP_ID=MMETSP0200_2-20121128/8882_1 /TAXON_ID=947934 /ORGANISM="Chaetoceros sp., Strain GSL56" /LENGTH=288 /DNA_ID=CAMNT_0017889767 /DNA_START=75 /DNA_END=941 /DNA_ORIENTATION=+
MSSEESSSSEEDVPLAALKNGKQKDSGNNQRRRSAINAVTSYKEESEEEEEYEFQSDDNQNDNGDDDDEDDDDDDDEDDKPLASLQKNKKNEKTTAVKKANTKSKPPKVNESKTKTKKKKQTISASESNVSSSSKATTSTIATVASELYSKSVKGKLISELLCRWWYAMTWPDPSAYATVPPNCDTLDGHPGVFVVTSGDEIGKIIDKRDPSTCPCFSNMVRKTSEELKELLLKAVENQTKILVEHEGKGTVLEKELDALKKWTSKVNTKKADKEAELVLRAANLKLK